MNCRDFLNEFEERERLSEAAALHLNDCAGCRKTSAAQTRVWQIIDEFKRVDAPNGFNFRVKARIADAKPNDFSSPLFPILRYVLPLSAVVLVLAFVVFNEIYSINDKTVPQVAESNYKLPSRKENLAANSLTPRQTAGDFEPLRAEQSTANNRITKLPENRKKSKTFEDKNQFAAVRQIKKPQAKTAKDDRENSGGSHDRTWSSPRIFMPKGTDSTKRIETLPNAGNANPITAEQILSQLGIEIASENGKRQVKKIKPNSVAERSGVRVGDLVEAIDGEKLSDEPIRAKTVEGKKLTIVRGAEKVEISLHN